MPYVNVRSEVETMVATALALNVTLKTVRWAVDTSTFAGVSATETVPNLILTLYGTDGGGVPQITQTNIPINAAQSTVSNLVSTAWNDLNALIS